jgi:hypothetical protein
MNREELDRMWNKALADAIRDGEEFTRYHFAALVAAKEREVCCHLFAAGLAKIAGTIHERGEQ